MALILLSCSTEKENMNEATELSTSTETLEFDADAGKQMFTVTSSAHFYVVAGDKWLTARKDTQTTGEDIQVTVTVEKNISGQERKPQTKVMRLRRSTLR